MIIPVVSPSGITFVPSLFNKAKSEVLLEPVLVMLIVTLAVPCTVKLRVPFSAFPNSAEYVLLFPLVAVPLSVK